MIFFATYIQLIHSCSLSLPTDGNERNVSYNIKSHLSEGFARFDDTLAVKVGFFFPLPSYQSKKQLGRIQDGLKLYKTTKPAVVDNLMKGLFACNDGIVFTNEAPDMQEARRKKYSRWYRRLSSRLPRWRSREQVVISHIQKSLLLKKISISFAKISIQNFQSGLWGFRFIPLSVKPSKVFDFKKIPILFSTQWLTLFGLQLGLEGQQYDLELSKGGYNSAKLPKMEQQSNIVNNNK